MEVPSFSSHSETFLDRTVSVPDGPGSAKVVLEITSGDYSQGTKHFSLNFLPGSPQFTLNVCFEKKIIFIFFVNLDFFYFRLPQQVAQEAFLQSFLIDHQIISQQMSIHFMGIFTSFTKTDGAVEVVKNILLPLKIVRTFLKVYFLFFSFW